MNEKGGIEEVRRWLRAGVALKNEKMGGVLKDERLYRKRRKGDFKKG